MSKQNIGLSILLIIALSVFAVPIFVCEKWWHGVLIDLGVIAFTALVVFAGHLIDSDK